MPSAFQRLTRLRRRLGGRADALLLTHLPNLLYLVGFRGTGGALVVTRKTAVLFVPLLYRLQARQEAAGAGVVASAGDPLENAVRWLERQRVRRVAYESARLTVAQFEQVRRRLEPAGAALVPVVNAVEALRAVKEPGEIVRLRASLEVTGRAFEEVLPYVRPGVRELELAAEIDYRLKRHGATGTAFPTIVASGPRAALPHGRASAKRLCRNELVIFDLGAILADYCGDMTRTVFVGTPSARVKRVYGAVREAMQAACERARPGVAAAAVDAEARGLLARRGLGRYFVHGTGHGLGLEVHEEPRVTRASRTPLAAGNVVTVEPGVYIPGWGGVRLEDVVAVGKGGAELLTPIPSELICL